MVARDENCASDASFYYKLELISNNLELAEALTHAQILRSWAAVLWRLNH